MSEELRCTIRITVDVLLDLRRAPDAAVCKRVREHKVAGRDGLASVPIARLFPDRVIWRDETSSSIS
jgi:hypothetical protein